MGEDKKVCVSMDLKGYFEYVVDGEIKHINEKYVIAQEKERDILKDDEICITLNHRGAQLQC